MSAETLLKFASILQFAVCLSVLCAMFRRRAVRDFPALAGFITLNAIGAAVSVSLLSYREALHIPKLAAYRTFFFFEWFSQLLGLVLLVLIIYGLFSESMRPFPGLQRIGKIVFRWVGAVSLLVAFALAVGPELFAKGVSAAEIYAQVTSRFEQGINVLILCLLIFVCFSIRPLGLTFRSHIFGVVLGLGIFSMCQLIQAAWLVTVGAHSLYSPIFSITVLGCCAAFSVWGTYFAMPEPERRMILLPTTSPFFLWNRISEILGDAPGQVAIAGFKPEMLAPAELEMLTAATSREASDLEREEALIGAPAPKLGRSELPKLSRPSLALSR